MPGPSVASAGRLSDRDTWLATLPPWAMSRLVVLAALALALLFPWHGHASLLSWDAAWYRDIAAQGYAGAPAGAVRYFPVWPLLARGVASVIAVAPGPVLVVLANLAALGYLATTRWFARASGHDGRVAAALPWVVALAPSGVVLVMGYSEALFGVVVCLVLGLSRQGGWWRCAGIGLLAGALRPTGAVLALPVLIEACRTLRGAPRREIPGRLAAVLAPALGLATYLGWSAQAYGDALLPFRAQLGPALRGSVLVSPLTTLQDAAARLGTGRLDTALVPHLLWIVVACALLVLGARRLPVSFTAFSAVTLFLAVTARRFSSFERYACSAVPLLLTASILLVDLVAARPRLRRWALPVGVLVLLTHAYATFAGWLTP